MRKDRPERVPWWEWGIRILLGLPVLFVVVFFLGLVATDPNDNLTLIETGFRTAVSGDRFVTGTIRNNTDHSYSQSRGHRPPLIIHRWHPSAGREHHED